MIDLAFWTNGEEACVRGEGVYFATGYYTRKYQPLSREQMEFGARLPDTEEVVDRFDTLTYEEPARSQTVQVRTAAAVLTRLCMNHRRTQLELVHPIVVTTPDAKPIPVLPMSQDMMSSTALISTSRAVQASPDRSGDDSWERELEPLLIWLPSFRENEGEKVTHVHESDRGGYAAPLYVAMRGVEQIVHRDKTPDAYY